jgi:hypothetical protein
MGFTEKWWILTAHSQLASLDIACKIHNHIFDFKCFLFSITVYKD